MASKLVETAQTLRVAIERISFYPAEAIKQAKKVQEIEHVLVVSRDSEALAMARELGARTVQENKNSDLNIALARATVIAKSFSTRGVLILPVDLPLITPEDIQAMLELAKGLEYESPVLKALFSMIKTGVESTGIINEELFNQFVKADI